MNSFENLKNILVSAAQQAGIDKYEIYYQAGSDISAETLKHELSNFSFGTTSGICFRCVIDGKVGYASTELMSEEEMYDLVKRASTNARFIDTDSKGIIFKGSASYGTKTSEYLPLPDVSVLKETALELQNQNYQQGDCVTDGTQAVVMAYDMETRIYNSEGLDLSNKASMSGGYSYIIINKDGEPSYGIKFAKGCNIDQFSNVPKQAYELALSKLNAGEVETGTYDIIISGEQMRSLLSAFWSIFSSKSIRLGTSLLKGKIGENIASECVTIVDDPFDPQCNIQTTFDAEGVAVYKKDIVKDGVLKTFLYNLSEAALANVESTANAYKGSYADTVGIRPYCFSIQPGTYDLEELFGIIGDGIYITETKGLHAGTNEQTGDFSIESAGFIVKGGKKLGAVKSFTISGNFYDLLKNITHIENKVDYGFSGSLNVFASPSVLIRNISVAGK